MGLRYDGGGGVANNGTISVGTFGGDVSNAGVISGGSFSGQIDNLYMEPGWEGSISGGAFTGSVVNYSTIAGGTFTGSIVNNNTIDLSSGGSIAVSSFTQNPGASTLMGAGDLTVGTLDNQGSIGIGSGALSISSVTNAGSFGFTAAREIPGYNYETLSLWDPSWGTYTTAGNVGASNLSLYQASLDMGNYDLTVGTLDNQNWIRMGTGALNLTTITNMGDFEFTAARELPNYDYGGLFLYDPAYGFYTVAGNLNASDLVVATVGLTMGDYDLTVSILDNSGYISVGLGALNISSVTNAGSFSFNNPREIPNYNYSYLGLNYSEGGTYTTTGSLSVDTLSLQSAGLNMNNYDLSVNNLDNQGGISMGSGALTLSSITNMGHFEFTVARELPNYTYAGLSLSDPSFGTFTTAGDLSASSLYVSGSILNMGDYNLGVGYLATNSSGIVVMGVGDLTVGTLDNQYYISMGTGALNLTDITTMGEFDFMVARELPNYTYSGLFLSDSSLGTFTTAGDLSTSSMYVSNSQLDMGDYNLNVGSLTVYSGSNVQMGAGALTVGTLDNQGYIVMGAGALNLTDITTMGSFDFIVGRELPNYNYGNLGLYASGQTFTTAGSLSADSLYLGQGYLNMGDYDLNAGYLMTSDSIQMGAGALTVGTLDNQGWIHMGTGALNLSDITQIGTFDFTVARELPDYSYSYLSLYDPSNGTFTVAGHLGVYQLSVNNATLNMGDYDLSPAYLNIFPSSGVQMGAGALTAEVLNNQGYIGMGAGALNILSATEMGTFMFNVAREIPAYVYRYVDMYDLAGGGTFTAAGSFSAEYLSIARSTLDMGDHDLTANNLYTSAYFNDGMTWYPEGSVRMGAGDLSVGTLTNMGSVNMAGTGALTVSNLDNQSYIIMSTGALNISSATNMGNFMFNVVREIPAYVYRYVDMYDLAGGGTFTAAGSFSAEYLSIARSTLDMGDHDLTANNLYTSAYFNDGMTWYPEGSVRMGAGDLSVGTLTNMGSVNMAGTGALTVSNLDNQGYITMSTGALNISSATNMGSFMFNTAREIPVYNYYILDLWDVSGSPFTAGSNLSAESLTLGHSTLNMGDNDLTANNLYTAAYYDDGWGTSYPAGSVQMGAGALTVGTLTNLGNVNMGSGALTVSNLDNQGWIDVGTGALNLSTITNMGYFMFHAAREIPDYSYDYLEMYDPMGNSFTVSGHLNVNNNLSVIYTNLDMGNYDLSAGNLHTSTYYNDGWGTSYPAGSVQMGAGALTVGTLDNQGFISVGSGDLNVSTVTNGGDFSFNVAREIPNYSYNNLSLWDPEWGSYTTPGSLSVSSLYLSQSYLNMGDYDLTTGYLGSYQGTVQMGAGALTVEMLDSDGYISMGTGALNISNINNMGAFDFMIARDIPNYSYNVLYLNDPSWGTFNTTGDLSVSELIIYESTLSLTGPDTLTVEGLLANNGSITGSTVINNGVWSGTGDTDSMVTNNGWITSGYFFGNDYDHPIGGTIDVTGNLGGNSYFSSPVTVQAGGVIEDGNFSGTVTNDGTIGSGYFTNKVTNNGTIQGGWYMWDDYYNNPIGGTIDVTGSLGGWAAYFSSPVTVQAAGIIEDGNFSGTVTNDGTIWSGYFANRVTNNGTIQGGWYHGNDQDHPIGGTIDVTSYLGGSSAWFSSPVTVQAGGGIIEDGNFSAVVTNNGTIWGGYFYGNDDQNPIGGTIDVNNPLGGTSWFSSPVTITAGDIEGGYFTNMVTNNAMILDGTFYGGVNNENGTIMGGFIQGTGVETLGGTFDIWTMFGAPDVTITAPVTVHESGMLYGGTFNNTVDNAGTLTGTSNYYGLVSNTGTIEGGYFYGNNSVEEAIGGTINLSTVLGGTSWFSSPVTIGELGLILSGRFMGDVSNGGSIVGGYFFGNGALDPIGGAISVADGYALGGTAYFSSPVTVAADEGSGGGTIVGGHYTNMVDNYGTIEDGVFDGDVTNYGWWSGAYGVINGGTFNGYVDNQETIYDGTFYGTVNNMAQIDGGTYYGLVSNDAEIYGGTFENDVMNYGDPGMGIHDGTFNGDVINRDYGVILGGTFNGDVSNGYWEGYWDVNGPVGIEGGTFNGRVTHGDSTFISGGTFTGSVDFAGGSITGGDFSNLFDLTIGNNAVWDYNTTVGGAVSNTGTISAGTFSGAVENGIFGDPEMLGTINGGTYSGMVTNNGTISAGTFGGSVYNQLGSISGGMFNGSIWTDFGSISNGTFNGDVDGWVGTISGGTFNGAVTIGSDIGMGSGIISGGQFNSTVSTRTDGIINGGTFDGAVTNNYIINNGLFNSTVNNTNGTINDGNFTAITQAMAGGIINGGTFLSAGYTIAGLISGLGSGISVALSLDGGTPVTTTTTDENGAFSFGSVELNGGEYLLIYANNGSYKANLVGIVQEAGDISGLELSDGRFSIGDADGVVGTTFTNADLGAAYYNNSNVYYSVTGNDVTFSDSLGTPIDVYVPSWTSYAPGGTVNGDGTLFNYGTLSSGVFNMILSNNATISGGTFNSTVVNGEFSPGTISDGEFNAEVWNYGDSSITGGTFADLVDNYQYAVIDGGTFAGAVTNSGTISDGTFDFEVYNLFDITGGTFNYLVYTSNDTNISGASFDPNYNPRINPETTITSGNFNTTAMDNYGTIAGGTFDAYVNLFDGSNVTGGTFNLGNPIIQPGVTITQGQFDVGIDNWGIIEGGVFTGSLINVFEYGTILGGTFNGAVTNNWGIDGGTFNASLNNQGGISGGTFNGVVNSSDWIYDGTFSDTSTVYNFNTIAGGTFSGDVYNEGLIQGGTFNGLVDVGLYGGISGGMFNGTVLQENYMPWTIGGGTFTGHLIQYGDAGSIAGGDFSGLSTLEIADPWAVWDYNTAVGGDVTNNGTISAGTFSGSVENGIFGDPEMLGTISGGTYSGTVNNNNGSISAGTFNGYVDNYGTVSGGTFGNTVRNEGGASITGGTFTATIDNSGLIDGGSVANFWNFGTISDGVFAQGLNYMGGSIDGGTFTGVFGQFTGAGSITGGDFSGLTSLVIDNLGAWDYNTAVGGDVTNNGTISAGTFNSIVKNYGAISGGAFTGSVTNQSTISGGAFNLSGDYTQTAGSFSGVTAAMSAANVDLQGGSMTLAGGLDVSGDLTIGSGAALDLAGNNIATTTNITNNGTLILQGGESISDDDVLNNDGSLVRYNGTSGPYPLQEWDYYDLTLAGDALYYVGSASFRNAGVIEENARALIMPSITAEDKVYDGTTEATLSAMSLHNIFTAYDVYGANWNPVFDSKDVGTSKLVTATVELGGADAGKFVAGPIEGVASITAKALAVTGMGAESRVYDGTTDAELDYTGAMLDGMIDGDDLTLEQTGLGLFADKNAGIGKTVNITGLTISGVDVGNYDFTTTATAKADITAKAVTLSGITASNKVYDARTDATVDASGATFNGMIDGDDLAVGAVSGSFSEKNVGIGKTVTLGYTAFFGADINNYVITVQPTTTASITEKAITLSGITAQNKVYDATTAATVDASGAIFNGMIDGDVLTVSSTGAFSDKNVADGKTVTLVNTLGGADLDNYAITDQGTTTANITAKAVTLSGITASDKVYDATTEATVDASGATFNGMIDGDDLTVSSTGAFANKNVGVGKMITLSNTLGGADLGNYQVTDQGTTTADITAKSITVTATAGQSKIYGDADPTFTYQDTGLLGGDTFSGALARAAGENVADGPYAINQGTLDAGSNYALTFVGNNFSITPYGVTVTADAGQSKVYGFSDPMLTYQSTGLLGGDSFTGVLARAAGENVADGPYAITQGTLDAGSNYSITFNGGTFSITARSITVTADAQTKVYGDSDPSLTYRVTSGSLVGSDSISGALSRAAGKNVGSYAIGQNTLTAGSNYVLSYIGANLSITAKAITLSGITAQNKVYDATTAVTVDASGATFNGMIDGDELTVSSTGTFSDKNVASGKTVTLSNTLGGTDLNNYTITDQTTTTANITKAAATLSGITAQNKVYDATRDAAISTALAAFAGKYAGDELTVSSTGVFSDKNVGNNKTVTLTNVLGGADLGNYQISEQSATTAGITARPITVTATGVNKTFDNTAQATVNLSDNRIAGDALNDTYTSAAFDTKDIGTNKTVTVNGIAISGADAANYNLLNTTATTTANITAVVPVTPVTPTNPDNSAIDRTINTVDTTVTTAGAGVGSDTGIVTAIVTNPPAGGNSNAGTGTGNVKGGVDAGSFFNDTGTGNIDMSGIMNVGTDTGNITTPQVTTTPVVIAAPAPVTATPAPAQTQAPVKTETVAPASGGTSSQTTSQNSGSSSEVQEGKTVQEKKGAEPEAVVEKGPEVSSKEAAPLAGKSVNWHDVPLQGFFAEGAAPKFLTDVRVIEGAVYVIDGANAMNLLGMGDSMRVAFKKRVSHKKQAETPSHLVGGVEAPAAAKALDKVLNSVAAEPETAPASEQQVRKSALPIVMKETGSGERYGVLKNPGKDVFVRSRDGEWKPARDGMVILPGDEVKTADQNSVDVLIDGGKTGRVEIKEGSLFRIQQAETDPGTGAKRTLLDLAMGKILVKVESLKGNSKFEVRTPTALTGVRGTIFEVTVKEKV